LCAKTLLLLYALLGDVSVLLLNYILKVRIHKLLI
jgi:hypothetical protein